MCSSGQNITMLRCQTKDIQTELDTFPHMQARTNLLLSANPARKKRACKTKVRV